MVTGGGPLILLPRETVDLWRGTEPPLDIVAPSGWTWGDGGIVCDYDRACDWPDRSFSIDDSHATWPVALGHREGLVLDGECSTTAVRWDDGLIVVRDLNLVSEADLLAMLEKLGEADWVDTGYDLIVERGLTIFDAAYPGKQRASADGGVIEVDLPPAEYRLKLTYPPDTRRTTMLRLVGPSGGKRGSSGVTIL